MKQINTFSIIHDDEFVPLSTEVMDNVVIIENDEVDWQDDFNLPPHPEMQHQYRRYASQNEQDESNQNIQFNQA
ncbi:hypothetical protein TVAG_010080 [Trichomonas vaginalis G3]|uniref:Uncharacterized protein n=1 Tax=Trichomonas vaginalis (strain ATCC PRA-98 / G3) TaxID=412133 RepID=A2FA24_TRIV3|nr:hypothetical protein TVAGG3_0082680 [Trichomonas vaginalis G3]EAX98232.1 hypothetical protein TVAG_010080 [Trichomonas vaginalis G3]KAI5543373.1 hypothetical protein TVAGG3_0082680 [Trichomonas vaginalis G3]|eukprot:XP_001311162.1 hypothetical protein [Trichomonas vaginalis G3]